MVFVKQPSKADLSAMLAKDCAEAMRLDDSIYTLYAAAPEPTRRPYKAKPVKPLLIDEPIPDNQVHQLQEPQGQSLEVSTSPAGEYAALEEAAKAFISGRRKQRHPS